MEGDGRSLEKRVLDLGIFGVSNGCQSNRPKSEEFVLFVCLYYFLTYKKKQRKTVDIQILSFLFEMLIIKKLHNLDFLLISLIAH